MAWSRSRSRSGYSRSRRRSSGRRRGLSERHVALIVLAIFVVIVLFVVARH